MIKEKKHFPGFLPELFDGLSSLISANLVFRILLTTEKASEYI